MMIDREYFFFETKGIKREARNQVMYIASEISKKSLPIN